MYVHSCVSHDDTRDTRDTGRSTELGPLQKLHGQKVCLSFGVSKKKLKIKQGTLFTCPRIVQWTTGIWRNFITTYHLGPPGMCICLEMRWILPWTWDIVYCPMKHNQNHVNCFIMQHHLAISFHIIHHHNDSQCMFQIVSTLSAT